MIWLPIPSLNKIMCYNVLAILVWELILMKSVVDFSTCYLLLMRKIHFFIFGFGYTGWVNSRKSRVLWGWSEQKPVTDPLKDPDTQGNILPCYLGLSVNQGFGRKVDRNYSNMTRLKQNRALIMHTFTRPHEEVITVSCATKTIIIFN